MNSESQSKRKRRETIITFTLFAMMIAIFVVFLNLVSFGLFFHVIAIVLGIMVIGFFHYALWGYGLSEEVTRERQAWLKEQQVELEKQEHPYAIHDRTRYQISPRHPHQPPDERIQK